MVEQVFRRIRTSGKIDPGREVDGTAKIDPVLRQTRFDTAISLSKGIHEPGILPGGWSDQVAEIEQRRSSKSELPVEYGSDPDIASLTRDEDVGESEVTMNKTR